jgi:2-succinyl-6-hydroxy-2,4-cyclohexadiene-1-carboxylate synthase
VADHLHVEIGGDAGKPALLLLHGFMSSNLQWALNRERLERHYRMAAAELWGHGKSPAPAAEDAYRVGRYVAELDRIRAALGAERWLVCGQSFGAGIAIHYALAHPEATRGLIFTNSRSAMNDVRGEAGRTGDAPTSWQTLDLRALPLHPRHARRFPSDLKARMEAAADACDRRALRLGSSVTAAGTCCRHLAGKISVPTLLVNGRFEKRFQPDRDFAAAAIPDIEVIDLDAGHSVNIEAPADFDRALIDFAARHP